MRIRKMLMGAVCSTVLMHSAAVAQEEEATDRIVVEGDPEVVTEDTGAYKTERATVGGRQPQDIRDVPQTVTVIPRQLIEDTGYTSIEEASRVLANLTEATGDGFVGSLYARGQEVFQYYVDGAPRPFLSLYGTAPDLYFFDRMEVLSGPSGVFQGSGEPVGTINLVRKRPTAERRMEFGTSIDTFGGYRGEADISGALNDAGTIRGRIVAYGEHEGSNVDITELKAGGIYGTLEADVTDATTISVGGIYEQSETVRHSGLPTFTNGRLVNFDPKTFIGSPDNNADIPTVEGFLEVEHEFENGSVFKATGRIYDRSSELRNLLASTGVDPATGDFSLFWFARDYEERSYYGDVNMTIPTLVFDRAVEFVGGVDYRRTESGAVP